MITIIDYIALSLLLLFFFLGGKKRRRKGGKMGREGGKKEGKICNTKRGGAVKLVWEEVGICKEDDMRFLIKRE